MKNIPVHMGGIGYRTRLRVFNKRLRKVQRATSYAWFGEVITKQRVKRMLYYFPRVSNVVDDSLFR